MESDLLEYSDQESRDFLCEAIILADQFRKAQSPRLQWQDNKKDYQDAENKSLTLYNWIALSLVREANDRAAIALYTYHDGFKVFYTKQNSSKDDGSHADEFAAFVRESAMNNPTEIQFRSQYFQLIFKNCNGIILSKYNELKLAMASVKEWTTSRGRPMKRFAIEELNFLLLSHEQRILRRKNLVLGSTDLEAMELTGIYDDVYAAFRQILKCLSDVTSHIPTEESIVQLCFLSWVVSRSQVIDMFVEVDSCVSRLMLKLSALGNYFDGVGLMYEMFEVDEFRNFFSGLELISVPPGLPRTVKLEKDWYRVIQTILDRTCISLAVFNHEKFLKEHVEVVEEASKSLAVPFQPHAERTLVDWLIAHGRRPTMIGVSTSCCQCCSAYIAMMNGEKCKNIKQFRPKISKWDVSGRRGSIDKWARGELLSEKQANAEAAVLECVYDEIHFFLRLFLSDLPDQECGDL
jgi:hypothetical protein